jgi:hypothetical protein
MNCEEARRNFAEGWRDALEATAKADLNAHLSTCERCRAEWADLGEVWSALGELPAEEPGFAVRARFYDSMRDWRRRESERQSRFWWSRHPAFQAAFAVLILMAGIAVGHVTALNSGQVAQLRGEVYNMRQLVALSLLQQQSASDRLRGVNYAYRVEQPDPEVLSALLTTVNHDQNVNVRLAAVDALRNFSSSPVGRRGIVQALGKQSSPLVQIALLDLVVELHDQTAVPGIRFLLSNAQVNPDVKQRAEWAVRQLQ